jgi:hypothetical protein
MGIEIGKEYMIYSKFKKSFEIVEMFKDNDTGDRCLVESNFRWGCYIIKIQNEQERELLQSYIQEDATGICEPECDFEDFELVESMDQCSCFFEPMLAEDSKLDAEWLEEELSEEGEDWFMGNNWDHLYTEIFMGLPLVLDPVDPSNRYQTRF